MHQTAKQPVVAMGLKFAKTYNKLKELYDAQETSYNETRED